jgi:hypothetical protein
MIAQFPLFSRVTLADKKFIDDFNMNFPPFADWAFGTLVTWWDFFNDLEVSLLDHNLVIRSSYLSMGKIPEMTLLGNHNIDDAINTLFEYQRAHHLQVGLPSLPQYTIDAIKQPGHYSVIENPDTAEYIFSAQTQATLEGSSMSQIRWRINQFNRSMKGHDVEVRSIPLNTLAAKSLLINTLHTWPQTIFKNDYERTEGLVIDRALALAKDIELHSIGLFIDDTLEGFALYKHLPQKHANINHVKVSYKYPNIFRYMLYVLATYLQKEGVDFLNGEMDLGIEGLRVYKSSLRPVHQLKKYDVLPLANF